MGQLFSFHLVMRPHSVQARIGVAVLGVLVYVLNTLATVMLVDVGIFPPAAAVNIPPFDIATFLLVVLVAPLMESLLLAGVVSALRSLSTSIRVVVCAIIFGIFHALATAWIGSVMTAIPFALYAAIFVWARNSSGLWPAIGQTSLCHIFYNAAGFFSVNLL